MANTINGDGGGGGEGGHSGVDFYYFIGFQDTFVPILRILIVP